MKKILLIDGNSMLFRAYYGTFSRGHMRSSEGVATNAVYGFSTMLNKALEIMEPTHILIAFDTGAKTFRHDKFDQYKGTRKAVDEDLVSQFALVREFLDEASIQRLELDGYEADDIIGTIAKMFPEDEVEILTSDRDLLQTIDNHVDVLLMKKGITEMVRMDEKALMEETGLTPSQIIDLKALMGDSSDNIPGVPSVGEKTAKKLLDQYSTLDGVYEHADVIKGKLGEKLREFKDQAYLSYELATIYTSVPVEVDLDSYKLEIDQGRLNAFYRKYDMNSLVKEVISDTEMESFNFVELDATWIGNDVSVVLDKTKEVINGALLSDGFRYAYVEDLHLPLFIELLQKSRVVASESKPLYRVLLDQGKDVQSVAFDDIMVLSFINSGVNTFDKVRDAYNLWFDNLDDKSALAKISKMQFSLWDDLIRDAKKMALYDVYNDIERPLTKVLAKCEHHGFTIDKETLDTIALETKTQIDRLSAQITTLAGREFNINSPKQLSEVLFDELMLPTKKKRSTAVDVLEGLINDHDIIPLLLEYRKAQKLYSTYAVGLQKHIGEDGKIHTHLNQHTTQTGRLSSSDPNLQNISVRDEEGRRIRSAFIPSEGNVLLSIDYSQIELRVLSFLADEKKMIEAFNADRDIHIETARDIFDIEEINSDQRREAKSVNFGIIYGMSDFGLSQQLDISVGDASSYIKKYHEIYPNISKYMDQQIELCESQGYVSTYFGRRRYIPEINDKNRGVKEFGKRAAMNAPIQGTAADIIKLAMIEVDQYLMDKKTKMILQVHDELVFDVVREELDSIIKDVTAIMERVVDWPITLKVSSTIGDTWMDS